MSSPRKQAKCQKFFASFFQERRPYFLFWSPRVTDVPALRAWLVEKSWPFWLAHGVDWRRGGFFEALDLHDWRCATPFRRLRVVARQIYVFSEAHAAGLAGAEAAVRLGLAFLENHAVHDEGGYAWRFDLEHRPIDLTRDLYDHAFVLLALSSAACVVGTEPVRARAEALMAWVDGAFAHPQGGYLESLPPALPRRQNPHMHLLEALLAAYEVFGTQVFLDRAQALTDLFAARLFDEASGALPEYFDDTFAPLRQDGAFLVEPGHHCEWVWLLYRAQALGVRHARLPEIAGRLMDFVDRFGIDPIFGSLVDVVRSDGRVVEGGTRLWPQTERLKAEFLRPDATAAKQREAMAALAALLRPDGLWHERRGTDGVLHTGPAPASSLYHLTAGIVTIAGK
jgi:mannose-6-phosphate isomerase